MRRHLRGRSFAARARHYTSAIASLSPTVDNQRGVYALETIYALSSAPGKAGVAVVRISGDQADACLQQLSRSTALPEPRVASLRKLFHPKTKEHLDDALVLRFPHPHSFTGEDVVELHTHGSVAVISGVLEALSHVPRCRAAEAGEFTERAFDNNKIDLVQVEGLADLLSAETEAQRGQALRQLSGDIGEIYEGWRDSLVKCLAYVEAMIDFGDDEDDVTDAAYGAAVDRVRVLADSIRGHLADGRRGEILRSGVQVAILGPPNAGKSSLLNVLARRPAAIVSSIAGTTRDVVQVPLNIVGYPVIVSDTAGLRETEDLVEKEGVLRAQVCADEADIRVVVLDVQHADQLQSSVYQSYLKGDAIVVLNKGDQVDDEKIEYVQSGFDAKTRSQLVVISCIEGDNIDVFVDMLAASVKEKLKVSAEARSFGGALITRERHRQNLMECLACLDRFLADPYQSEIAAEDLRRAVTAIGRILGRIDVEDVLNVLFSDFCIGK
uniref:TrmE-type G domain-containing protein n=1 Tax=Peronospora matthiolae TaxID=2874970 RepID=A0AAV1UJX7_9STRA